MTLGENLQRLRKARGLSQDEVAQKLFLTRQSVSKWENGQAEPGVENLKALAGLYGVSVDVLIGNEAVPEPPLEEPAKQQDCVRWYQIIVTVWTILVVCENIISTSFAQRIDIPFNWLFVLVGLKVRKWSVWAGILSMTVFSLLHIIWYSLDHHYPLFGIENMIGTAAQLLVLFFCLHRKTREYFHMLKDTER